MNIALLTNAHNTSLRGGEIKYIAVHYTAGLTSARGSARSVARWFANPKCGASADFIVDDYEAVQYNPNPKSRYCWAVGATKKAPTKGGKLFGMATNKNTVSVEICSSLKEGKTAPAPNNPAWYFTEESFRNAVELVKELMRHYNIPASNVIRHYDVTGKLCPGVVGWNEDSKSVYQWKRFKKALND